MVIKAVDIFNIPKCVVSQQVTLEGNLLILEDVGSKLHHSCDVIIGRDIMVGGK